MTSEVKKPQTEVQSEIAKFGVTTPVDDILTKRSSFNPYPEQASEGISVWNIVKGDFVQIRYEETGKMYWVSLPVYRKMTSSSPRIITIAPQPYVSKDGTTAGEWREMDVFLRDLGIKLVQQEAYANSYEDTYYIDALVKSYKTLTDDTIEPTFEEPNDAFIKVIKAAALALAQNDWRAASRLADCFNTSQCEINGKKYDVELADYTNEQFVFEAVPSLVNENHRRQYYIRDEILYLIKISIKAKALQIALEEFKDSPVAQIRINTSIEMMATHKQETIGNLLGKSDADRRSYLSQVRQFFEENGISSFVL